MTEDELAATVASFFNRPVAAIWHGQSPTRLSTAEVHASLATVIEEVTGIDPTEVTIDKAFIAELGIDSLSAAEIAMRLEDKHGITSPLDGLLRLHTVGDAVSYLQQALAGNTRPTS